MLYSDTLRRFCFKCCGSLKRLQREEGGATAIMTALAMVVLVGFVGLGTEVGLWYADRRAMQTAADAAAMGGAWVVYEEGKDAENNPQITTAALKDSKANGFDDAAADVTVTVNHPPQLAASKNKNHSSVEAIITKQRPTLFASFFLGQNVDVSVRSVASLKITKAPCILALAPNEDRALFFSGTADVHLNKCGINVNSNDEDGAMTAQGASVVGAAYADIVGGLTQSNNAELLIEDITTGADPKADPYAHLNVPEYDSTCDFNNVKVGSNKTATLTPGTYCGGVHIQGTATFQPGDYVIEGGILIQGTAHFGAGNYVIVGGVFDVRAGAVVTTDTVDGVTFFLTGIGTNYAQVQINGTASVSVTAAKSGDYMGLAFFQDRNAPVVASGGGNQFNGSSSLNVTGALYFPNQMVTFNGGSEAAGTCTRIVAFMVQFTGEAGLTLGCGYDFGETAIYPPIVVE